MSNTNTNTLSSADAKTAAELREERKNTIAGSLSKRHRKEKTFRVLGFSAVVTGLFFVVLLFGSILAKGLPSFWQSSLTVPVYFDPAVINVGAKPKPHSNEEPAKYQERLIEWQTQLGMADWDL